LNLPWTAVVLSSNVFAVNFVNFYSLLVLTSPIYKRIEIEALHRKQNVLGISERTRMCTFQQAIFKCAGNIKNRLFTPYSGRYIFLSRIVMESEPADFCTLSAFCGDGCIESLLERHMSMLF